MRYKGELFFSMNILFPDYHNRETSCERAQACHTCKETNKNANISSGIDKKVDRLEFDAGFGFHTCFYCWRALLPMSFLKNKRLSMPYSLQIVAAV